jgi:hypothetical protein
VEGSVFPDSVALPPIRAALDGFLVTVYAPQRRA